MKYDISQNGLPLLNTSSVSGSPPAPAFPRLPGETPRAFSAFVAFFQLGHARSLPALADKLGEGLGTVKNWSSKFDRSGRLHSFHSGLLRGHAQTQAGLQNAQAAEWHRRLEQFREQEWNATQKLIAAAQCFLETFGEEEMSRMTLAQVSRALKISSAIARSALLGAELPASSGADLSPLHQQLLNAVKRLYGQNASSPPPPPSSGTTAVNN
jgi:hypothetical protein